MDKYKKELAFQIAKKLIKLEDYKKDPKRPEGQTLYFGETKIFMEGLTKQVLLEMGYEE